MRKRFRWESQKLSAARDAMELSMFLSWRDSMASTWTFLKSNLCKLSSYQTSDLCNPHIVLFCIDSKRGKWTSSDFWFKTFNIKKTWSNPSSLPKTASLSSVLYFIFFLLYFLQKLLNYNEKVCRITLKQAFIFTYEMENTRNKW